MARLVRTLVDYSCAFNAEAFSLTLYFLSLIVTVPVWVYGMAAPTRVIDNTDLALMVANAFGTDLDKVSSRLFVDLDTAGLNYTLHLADRTNLTVQVGDAAVFPIGRDYYFTKELDGEKIMLPGLTVYAPKTGKVYISTDAIQKVKEASAA